MIRTKSFLVLVFSLLWTGKAIAQCVMCSEVAGKEDKAVGINEGILYLMAAPYLVMAAALIGFLLYRRHKKKKSIKTVG